MERLYSFRIFSLHFLRSSLHEYIQPGHKTLITFANHPHHDPLSRAFTMAPSFSPSPPSTKASTAPQKRTTQICARPGSNPVSNNIATVHEPHMSSTDFVHAKGSQRWIDGSRTKTTWWVLIIWPQKKFVRGGCSLEKKVDSGDIGGGMASLVFIVVGEICPLLVSYLLILADNIF
ncbi:hypothetical protein RIF29_19684 [Crotalaria pallida]|uniref:Uncharacterized protein n=1 Tax=Crotalaria pallida TaxID=3830 RepID=A0AAN9F273_CROPI